MCTFACDTGHMYIYKVCDITSHCIIKAGRVASILDLHTLVKKTAISSHTSSVTYMSPRQVSSYVMSIVPFQAKHEIMSCYILKVGTQNTAPIQW